MPFQKVGKDDYRSPSGRHFDKAQVELYYAHGGSFPGEKNHPAHTREIHRATYGKRL